MQRARWHLWAVTFAIIAALVGGISFLSGHTALDRIPFLPPSRLRLALVVIAFGFVIYAVDRERHLRKLSESLMEERISSAQLATQISYLRDLQQERDTNAALLDGAADGIAVVDANLCLLRFNGAMEQLCGIAVDGDAGTYAPAVLRFGSPDGRALTAEEYPLRAVLNGNEPPGPLDLRLHVAGGQERWVSGTFSGIAGPDGRPALALAVLRDVTKAKETEQMQRDFVSIVSHELRAPLTAIKGFAKTLLQRGDSLPAETRESFLSTVNAQSDRLARLVDDLLQVSRIDARRLRIEVEPQSVHQMMESLAMLFHTRWHRRVDVSIPDGLPAVTADRNKLEEILINLVDNAIKYSPADEPVQVTARETNGEIEISVEDHGDGISPDDAAKLFQKFQRLSTPATRDVGGTGLGLYIVKGLVDAMGGRVWIESAPGSGSTFAFALPVAEEGAAGLDQVGA